MPILSQCGQSETGHKTKPADKPEDDHELTSGECPPCEQQTTQLSLQSKWRLEVESNRRLLRGAFAAAEAHIASKLCSLCQWGFLLVPSFCLLRCAAQSSAVSSAEMRSCCVKLPNCTLFVHCACAKDVMTAISQPQSRTYYAR